MTVSIPNAKLRTRRKWVFRTLLAWGTLGLPVAMAGVGAGLVSNLLFALLPIAYFAGIFALERASRRWLALRSGELRADETGLLLAGKRLVKRSDLTHGHIVREGEQLLLRLVLRGGADVQPIDVEIADEAQGSELLAAMFLDRTVAEYTMFANHLRPATLRIVYGGAGGVLCMAGGIALSVLLEPHVFPAWRPLLLLLFCIPPLIGMILGVAASEIFISVGADGVWLRRPLVQKRFVSFSQLRNVEQAGENITLTLADGTTTTLHCRRSSEEEGTNLVARIRAGIEAFQAAPQHTGQAVARNGRTAAEWLASTNRQHERSASYRQPVVPQDQLWRIVEDPAAQPTERAGAALALRADLTDEGRARLRVAAGACAEQQLRVALESVVTADDEALLAALDPLVEPARARLSRS